MKYTMAEEIELYRRAKALQDEADEREAADMTPEQRAKFWRWKRP